MSVKAREYSTKVVKALHEIDHQQKKPLEGVDEDTTYSKTI